MNNELQKNICRKCVHYLQHYVFVNGGYRWAYLGHCTQGRLRPRRPDDKACERYREVPAVKK